MNRLNVVRVSGLRGGPEGRMGEKNSTASGTCLQNTLNWRHTWRPIAKFVVLAKPFPEAGHGRPTPHYKPWKFTPAASQPIDVESMLQHLKILISRQSQRDASTQTQLVTYVAAVMRSSLRPCLLTLLTLRPGPFFNCDKDHVPQHSCSDNDSSEHNWVVLAGVITLLRTRCMCRHASA